MLLELSNPHVMGAKRRRLQGIENSQAVASMSACQVRHVNDIIGEDLLLAVKSLRTISCASQHLLSNACIDLRKQFSASVPAWLLDENHSEIG